MDVDKENKEQSGMNTKGILKSLSTNTIKLDTKISAIEGVEDIKEQLYNIEVHTKQSQVDLSELVNRLKNNNENLQKLLGSLVQNSNLSKDDVIEIFEDRKVNPRDIIDPIVEELQAVHLDDKLIRLLESILDRLSAENDTYKLQDEVKEMLIEEKSQLTRLESMIELSDLSQLKASIRDMITQNSQTLAWQNDIKSHLNDLSQKSAVQDTQNNINELTSKYEALQQKYGNLESRYTQLSKLYTSKYESLQELQLKYRALIELTQEEIKPNYEIVNKLEELHNHTLSQIQLPKTTKKRIVSTPIINEDDEN